MKNDDHIKKEVEKTVDLLENPQKVKADPYFYTRLQAKIDEQSIKSRQTFYSIFGSRILSPVLLTFFLIVNIISSIILLSDNSSANSSVRDSYIDTFSQEYSLDVQPFEDYTTSN